MLDDKLDLKEENVTDHHFYDLGKWIMNSGSDRCRTENNGLRLENVHEKLHSEIKNIVRSKNTISREGCEEMFTELIQVSNEVIQKLVRIY